MPANLPPQYFEAERIYREAKTPEEKIAALEEILAIMPKHKGTDHLRGELRAKIAKLTEASGKKTALHRGSTVVPKEGAGQVAVVGPPNSGKSQLVARVTNAPTVVADYPFTTTSAIPGMMPYENIKIQLVDLPPVVAGVTEPWVASALYRADALLIILDLSDGPATQMDEMDAALAGWRIRLGETAGEEQPVVLMRYKRAVIAGNKIDVAGAEDRLRALQAKWGGRVPVVGISAKDVL